MRWMAAAVLAVTAGQDVREREIGLNWIRLFALICAGGGNLMNVPERICAVIPGIFLMALHALSPDSVGEGDALMIWGMGFSFSPEAVWTILTAALISAGAAGVCRGIFSRKKEAEDLPFLLFLLWAYLLRLPLL